MERPPKKHVMSALSYLHLGGVVVCTSSYKSAGPGSISGRVGGNQLMQLYILSTRTGR